MKLPYAIDKKYIPLAIGIILISDILLAVLTSITSALYFLVASVAVFILIIVIRTA